METATTTPDEMLDYDFFADDKDCSGILLHTAKVVTTRVEHECLFSPETLHVIPTGSIARVDKALVDGEWKSFYSCLACHEAARRAEGW